MASCWLGGVSDDSFGLVKDHYLEQYTAPPALKLCSSNRFQDSVIMSVSMQESFQSRPLTFVQVRNCPLFVLTSSYATLVGSYWTIHYRLSDFSSPIAFVRTPTRWRETYAACALIRAGLPATAGGGKAARAAVISDINKIAGVLFSVARMPPIALCVVAFLWGGAVSGTARLHGKVNHGIWCDPCCRYYIRESRKSSMKPKTVYQLYRRSRWPTSCASIRYSPRQTRQPRE
jgi:hypothetical protein